MNIVTVPFHDYKKWLSEGFRTRDAHVFEHLARRSEVEKILVVNRPTSMAELIVKRQGTHIKEGSQLYKRKGVCLTQTGEKTFCIDIFLPDFLKVARQGKAWWFTAFRYKRVTDAINEALGYLGMESPLLLLQNPMAIGAYEGLNCGKFVFDAIDNWLYHPQMKDKELIKNNYRLVEKNADMIMTVSQALTELFPENKNVRWIPNGVDVDYFKGAFKSEPSEKMTVGYIGKIQDRVDFGLVESCLQKYPDFEFVFAGPALSQQDRIDELKKQYSNIKFLGDIHYTNLPETMKSFDIAVIPHKVDEFTASMNPLKLYEYLAAGKPVVTTAVAGTENISPFVFPAKDSYAFIRILGETAQRYAENAPEPQEIADSLPEECRWDYRVSCMLEEMKKL